MPALPPDVERGLQRGRKEMRKDAAKRRLCMRFERGDTYWYINGRGVLDFQSTVTNTNGTGKPPHRIRNTYNFIRPIVEAKVSAATQRVPSAEIIPTGTDPETIAAAGLSERVARYGYDQWGVRRAAVKTVKLAIAGGGDGFAYPYFDPDVGPYRDVKDRKVGQGEIKILVLNGNQVYWKAGTDFEDSPWVAIERARPLDDVKRIPGFLPKLKLSPDGNTSDIPTDREKTDDLVMVTEYFERPSPKYPEGRCMVIAGGQTITDYRLRNPGWEHPWGPYPLQDADGTVLDEPLLHRLSYTVDPETDHDLGLTWQLIDYQRTAQDCMNKLLEWKNRTLNPQMIAPVGSIITSPDDVPGAVRYYRMVAGQKPEWERPPAVPEALFRILERTVQDMRDVAADVNFDVGPNVAARTVQAGIEQSQSRWQSFLGDLAEWYSRLIHHCLVLVSKHYSEERLLQIRGRDGWELTQQFRGANLMGQTKVIVLPQSLQPLTRQGIQDRLTWLNQNFPGFLNPEAALTALEAGNLDRLTQSYWLDVGQANTIIQKIRDGTVMDMPDRSETDPVTNQQLEVPAWMPSEVSNLNVWKQVFGDFMKTDEFERFDPEQQEVCKLVWQGIQQLEVQRAQREAMLQQQQAAELGMQNAAKPQNGKPMPSLPGSGQTPAPA